MGAGARRGNRSLLAARVDESAGVTIFLHNIWPTCWRFASFSCERAPPFSRTLHYLPSRSHFFSRREGGLAMSKYPESEGAYSRARATFRIFSRKLSRRVVPPPRAPRESVNSITIARTTRAIFLDDPPLPSSRALASP